MAGAREIEQIVEELGQPYSAMLGIRLHDGDTEWLKWFLAAFLYAKPIREESATKTYQVFISNGLTTAAAIADASRDKLIRLLGEGGYTRYDESTATRLHAIFGHLQEEYEGKLIRLYAAAKDSRDLERRIAELGKGIGPVTVEIFLRDMRMVWPKADPEPTPRVREVAKALGIGDLKEYTRKNRFDPVRLETAMHRYSRQLKKHPWKPSGRTTSSGSAG